MITDERVHQVMIEAEMKAWESLSGYKFIMFGYHASRWINYNQLLQEPRPSPFRELVKVAREMTG